MFKIVHLQTQKEYEITGPTKLGRLDVEILFEDDRRISKEHCLFDVLNDQLIIKDLKSSNGTFVNGDRVKPFENFQLNDGDHIKIGQQEFKVRSAAKGEDKYGEVAPVVWFQEQLDQSVLTYLVSWRFLLLFGGAAVIPALWTYRHLDIIVGLPWTALLVIAAISVSSTFPAFILIKPTTILTIYFWKKGFRPLVAHALVWFPVLFAIQWTLFSSGIGAVPGLVAEINRVGVLRHCVERESTPHCQRYAVGCVRCLNDLAPEARSKVLGLLGWHEAEIQVKDSDRDRGATTPVTDDSPMSGEAESAVVAPKPEDVKPETAKDSTPASTEVISGEKVVEDAPAGEAGTTPTNRRSAEPSPEKAAGKTPKKAQSAKLPTRLPEKIVPQANSKSSEGKKAGARAPATSPKKKK
jgi:pSer/pThr/pTyr-binding forkhead associated (FHA) protein